MHIVEVTVSGMPSLSQERYPFRDLHAHIRTLVDALARSAPSGART
jgi:hypothetical protein